MFQHNNNERKRKASIKAEMEYRQFPDEEKQKIGTEEEYVKLSSEDRKKIKAEIGYRHRVGLKLSQPQHFWSQVWDASNHPIFITVLGGLLIAFAGSYFQHSSQLEQQRQLDNSQLRQQRQLYSQRIQDKKYALLSKVTERLDKERTLLVNIKYFQISLKKPNEKDGEYLNRDRQEILRLYEKVVEEYAKQKQAVPLLAEINGLFKDPKVKEEAKTLADTLLNMDLKDSFTEEEVKKFEEDTAANLRELTLAMAEEVQKEEKF